MGWPPGTRCAYKFAVIPGNGIDLDLDLDLTMQEIRRIWTGWGGFD